MICPIKDGFSYWGSRGIGLGIAQALAKEGWNLILNGMRPEDQVTSVLDELRALDCQVAYAQGDIGSAKGRNAIREVALKACAAQAVNLLVNNAGVAPKERLDLLETTEETTISPRYQFGPLFLSQGSSRHGGHPESSPDSRR